MSARSRAVTRLAAPEDVPALVRLINRAYRVEDFFINGDRTHEADIRERLQTPHACFLVIDDGVPTTLAGGVYVELRGVRGFFGLLSVDPDRQGQGLGQRLVEAVEEHSRAAGCRFLDLDIVNLRQELPSFYARLGFTPVASAPFPQPRKLRRDAHLVLMSKSLG